ncbi:MAG: PhzF family phenazine biosynthesis protein [Gammaproteobacteria bacterium]|nr:PhzF family phenazine biosynthesis protein [Gammaproteobacteria bacterium]
MKAFPFALYDAFSATVFGGSQAAVITDAKTIKSAERQRIAREIGMPATAFVDDYGDDWIQVQFMSTVMELPMCGHGTICLLTHLLESERIRLDQQLTREVELRLPRSTATVELSARRDARYQVMLDIIPPRFEAPPPHTGALLKVLGLEASALANDLPLETARGDFIHLVVPLTGLEAIRAIEPDFNGMIEFCHAYGVETIAVFCSEVENSANSIHVRDFCPAVGVSESAAAGTTNATLASYLVRHDMVTADADIITVNAEQGLELGRPSSVQSRVTLIGQEIDRLQVGGVATRVLDGQVYL